MTPQFHNPANLTHKQIGTQDGWRLLTTEEMKRPLPKDAEYFAQEGWRLSADANYACPTDTLTYRTRTPLPTDPLHYFEHILPEVIRGVRKGKRWEIMLIDDGGGEWVKPFRHTLEYFTHHMNNPSYRVRLAPEPKTRAWNCPNDVPAPICWLRHPNGRMSLVVEFDDNGVALGGTDRMITWIELAGEKGLEPWEYSTDRITWSACEITEP